MFKIIKKNYGYVIVNTDLDIHVYFQNYKGCKVLIHLIDKNVNIKIKPKQD